MLPVLPVLPVLLALGLAGRLAALGLSVVNVVAVLSLTAIAPAAFAQHPLWGALLLLLLLWGSGRWSLDALLANRLDHRPGLPPVRIIRPWGGRQR